jgi:hypothetical protein
LEELQNRLSADTAALAEHMSTFESRRKEAIQELQVLHVFVNILAISMSNNRNIVAILHHL